MARAVVISQMDPPLGDDQEFDSWQEGEDVPLRMRVPSFRSAVRTQAVQGLPSRLVVHYLPSLRVLESSQYLEIEGTRVRVLLTCCRVLQLTRGDAEPGRFFFLFTFSVPEDFEDELDAFGMRGSMCRY